MRSTSIIWFRSSNSRVLSTNRIMLRQIRRVTQKMIAMSMKVRGKRAPRLCTKNFRVNSKVSFQVISKSRKTLNVSNHWFKKIFRLRPWKVMFKIMVCLRLTLKVFWVNKKDQWPSHSLKVMWRMSFSWSRKTAHIKRWLLWSASSICVTSITII